MSRSGRMILALVGLLVGVGIAAPISRAEPPCRQLEDGAEIRGAITKPSIKHESGRRVWFYRMTTVSPVCLPDPDDETKKVRSVSVHVVPDTKADQTRLEAAVKSGSAVTVTANEYFVRHTVHHHAPIVAMGSKVSN